METQALMQILLEIERALQKRDCARAYSMVLNAEDCLLRVEQESLGRQAEKLRRAA